MESGPDETQPPAPPSRIDFSLSAILTAFGVAMVVFVPGKGRVFGMAFLALAVGVFARDVVFPRQTAVRAFQAARGLRARISRAWAALPFDPVRWLIGLAGLASLGGAVLLWRDEPQEYAWFTAALGAIAVAASLAWPWMAGLSNHIFMHIVAGLFALSAVAGLTWMVVEYASNIPFFDEHISTLYLITEYPDMTRGELTSALVATHYSHMILTTRVLALLDLAINGEINFLHLIWTSYAFFLGTVAIVYAKLPATMRSPLYFAPFALVLFQPQFHQITLWGFSIPHFGCFFFSAMAFALLERNQRGSLLAIVAFAAATYSFALGVFVGVIGVAYLVDAGRNREAIYWAIPLGLVVTRQFSAPELFSENTLNTLGYSGATLSGKLLYLLEFSGSLATLGYFSDFMNSLAVDAKSVEYVHARWIARVTGALLLTGFAYVSIRRYWRRNLPVYGLLLLTVLAAVATADQRNVETTVGNSTFLSRYAINSVLMMGLVYLALADLHTGVIQRIAPFVVLACAVFCALSYAITLPYARNHAADLRFTGLHASNAVYQGAHPRLLASPLFSLEAVRKAVQRDAYSIPEKTVTEGLVREPQPIQLQAIPERSLAWNLVYVGENEQYYTFMAGPRSDGAPLPADENPRVLLAARDGETVAVPLIPLMSLPGHLPYLQFESPDGADRVVCVAKSALPEGVLKVSLAVADGRESTGMAVPTIDNPESVLAPLPVAALFHAVGRRLYTPAQPDGWSTTAGPETGAPMAHTGRFTVEAVVRVGELSPARNAKLWSITTSGPDGERTVQLSLLGHGLVVFVTEGQQWHEVMRIGATANTWNWIGVSVDGERIYQFVTAYDPVAGVLGPLQFDAKPLAPAYPSGAGALEIGTGIDPAGTPIADIFELRVMNEAATVDTLGQRWPAFRAPQSVR